MASAVAFNPLRVAVAAPKAAVTPARSSVRVTALAAPKPVKAVVAAAPAVLAAAPAMAAQEIATTAAEVNILGLIATALFILIPTSLLITLFVKSESEGNVSGGFDQDYYDAKK